MNRARPPGPASKSWGRLASSGSSMGRAKARRSLQPAQPAGMPGDNMMNARPMAAIGPRALRLLVVALSLAASPLGWQTAAAHPAAPPGPHGPYAPQAVTHPIPTHGNQKMLVILADFPDRVGLFSGQAWQT